MDSGQIFGLVLSINPGPVPFRKPVLTEINLFRPLS